MLVLRATVLHDPAQLAVLVPQLPSQNTPIEVAVAVPPLMISLSVILHAESVPPAPPNERSLHSTPTLVLALPPWRLWLRLPPSESPAGPAKSTGQPFNAAPPTEMLLAVEVK